MSINNKEIMDLLTERGVLRFSTLMLRFHISSMEAIRIVDEYQKKGIIDNKGKSASAVKTAWKNPYAEDTMKTDLREKQVRHQSDKEPDNSKPLQQEVQKKASRNKKDPESDRQNISKSKDKKNSRRTESKPVQPQSSDGLLAAENLSKKSSKKKPEPETVSVIKQKSPASNPVQMSFLEETESPKPRRNTASKTATRKSTTKKKKEVDGQISLF